MPTKFSELKIGEYRYLWLKSNHLDECMKYFVSNKLDGVYLSIHNGFKLPNLQFFKSYPFVQRVSVMLGEHLSLSGLKHLTNLKSFTMEGNREAIDFGDFAHLERLRIEWHPKVKLPTSHNNLKELYLQKYNPPSGDLQGVSQLSNLTSLEIIQSTIDSLRGSESLKKLTTLVLAYFPKLDSIVNLKSNSIKILEFTNCKKIRDWELLIKIKSLYFLKLSNTGSIPSLRFISQLPNLKKISFVDSEIIDGDLRPCIGLEHVGFFGKKHYTHTPKEMERLLNKVGAKPKK